MAKEVRVHINQSLFDIALQEYGHLDAAFDIAEANGMSVTDMPDTGTELKLPESDSHDRDMYNLYRNDNIRPATGINQIPEWA